MDHKRRAGGRSTPPSGKSRSRATEVTASGRYTPAKASYRVRPPWHRLAGWTGVILGVVIAVLNDGMYVTEANLLPFGHSELYLMLALLVGGASTWFLGLFDRGTTIYE